MPELPDVTVYVEAIARRIVDQPLLKLRLGNPFVLRTVDPPPSELSGKRVTTVRRFGKRIVIGLESELFVVIHLMIAGRAWGPAPTTGSAGSSKSRERRRRRRRATQRR